MAYPEQKRDVEIPDKIIFSDNQRFGSPVGSETSSSLIFLRTFKRRVTPDLTGSVQKIKLLGCGGGFGDIYAGELTSKRGQERVALKKLRTFGHNKKAVKAGKVCTN